MRRLLAIAALLCCPLAASPAWAGWGPDTVLGTNAIAAAQQLTLGGDGTIALVWLQGTQSAQDVMAAVHPPGGPWGAPEKISGGADTSSASVGADAAGNLVAVWTENGYVRASVRPSGGSWQPVAVPLSGASASSLGLAVAPDGTAVVVWREGGELKVSTRTPGGAFSSASTINTGTNPFYPAVAAGPQSDFLIAWEDNSGSATRVMSEYRTAGGPSFGSPVSVVSATPSVNNNLYFDNPIPVFNGAGEASVTWLKVLVDNPNNQQFLAWQARWRGAGSGGSWFPQLPQQLEAVTINNTLPGGLIGQVSAADASGRTGVVFRSLNSASELFSARPAGTGNGFGAPQTITGAVSPRGALGASGSSLLYAEPNPMAIAAAPAGGSFGALDSSPFSLSGTGLAIAVGGDAGNDLWAAYTDSANSIQTLHFRAYDTVAPEARNLSIPASATAGAPVDFSVTPWDALTGASASWDFGDGTTATGSAPSHTYATAGDRTVTVTVTDGAGNATTATQPISVAPAPAPAAPAAPGAGAGGTPPPDTVAPVLSRVAAHPQRFRLSALRLAGRRAPSIGFTLSEAATVRLTVTRVGSRKVLARLRSVAHLGAGRIALTRRAAPRSGRYRARLVAVDAAGNVSRAVTVGYRVSGG